MRVTKLFWAGAAVEAQGRRLLIDPLGRTTHLTERMGPARQAPEPLEGAAADIALVTHRHSDHFDPETLRWALKENAEVLCPVEMAKDVDSAGLKAIPCALYNELERDPFKVVGVPAVDGLGEAQVSWVVMAEGSKLFHGGDTLWHGHWWRVARKYGPFDVAALPVNGAIVHFPELTQSGIAASLTPEQAVAATVVLQAKKLCPIHHGVFNTQGSYEEWPYMKSVVDAVAAQRGVRVVWSNDGEVVE